ncbi:MAG: hypothetical protein PHS95_00510 [Candidatus Pacebacteria bacterium]|nr:hypothetical protein [Candidatus Paceibacterota bacterium]
MNSLGLIELVSQVGAFFSFLFQWFPLWGPIILISIFWNEWMYYIQADFRAKMEWVLLEIKLPKEIQKTPLAMEIALGALYQSSAGEWHDKYWHGKVKDWFSLEMVSIEGHVKFFVRCIKKYKNLIETQFYAQYPDIEIFEVPDYTRYIDFKGMKGEWDVFGSEYKLTKADPLPIRTYVDYGLDRQEVEEEFKIDPLTSIIEYLGSMGKDEQFWIQILVRASGDDWKKEGAELVKEMAGRNKKSKDDKAPPPILTKGESQAVENIERHMGKLGFDCGIRALYVAKKEKFSYGNIAPLLGLLKPFSNSNANGFKPTGHTIGFDFPWQKYYSFDRFVLIPEFFTDGMAHINQNRKEQFEAYKHRSWFYPPHPRKSFLLTSEELATIFHFPGGVAQTPTFGRIPSKKSEAPINLPI